MREEGVNLLSHSLSLSDGSSSDKALAYTNFISTGLKFLSFLEVSYIGGIISEMNYSILKYEFESLIKTAEAKEMGSNPKGLIFSENFFTLPDEIENRSESLSKEISPSFLSKGHNIMSDRASFKKAAETVRPSDLKQKDKSNRQDIILSLLKKDSELGIKDFTSAIKGCSEKTIQRELVTLVSKGQIKKMGEKRWSRYSLK